MRVSPMMTWSPSPGVARTCPRPMSIRSRCSPGAQPSSYRRIHTSSATMADPPVWSLLRITPTVTPPGRIPCCCKSHGRTSPFFFLFWLLLLIARAHEPELIIDLEDVAEQYLTPGQTLSLGDDAVELRVDVGTLVVFDAPAESPPCYVGRIAQLGGGGRVTLTLATAETWFELGFEVQGQGGATIRAYDSEERPVFEKRISEPGARWIRYDGAAPARRIVIDVDELAVFDNLRLGCAGVAPPEVARPARHAALRSEA